MEGFFCENFVGMVETYSRGSAAISNWFNQLVRGLGDRGGEVFSTFFVNFPGPLVSLSFEFFHRLPE